MTTDFENLAERLRSLYQLYSCENELPAHDDLAAKLGEVKPEVIEAIRMELDRDCCYSISKEKAREEAKIPLSEKVKMLYAFTLVGAVTYAEDRCNEKNLPCEGFPFFIRAVYGGIKNFPSAVKTAFLSLTEEEVTANIEERNEEAAIIFKGFKNQIEYLLKS